MTYVTDPKKNVITISLQGEEKMLLVLMLVPECIQLTTRFYYDNHCYVLYKERQNCDELNQSNQTKPSKVNWWTEDNNRKLLKCQYLNDN